MIRFFVYWRIDIFSQIVKQTLEYYLVSRKLSVASIVSTSWSIKQELKYSNEIRFSAENLGHKTETA